MGKTKTQMSRKKPKRKTLYATNPLLLSPSPSFVLSKMNPATCGHHHNHHFSIEIHTNPEGQGPEKKLLNRQSPLTHTQKHTTPKTPKRQLGNRLFSKES
jgi:hypothetical protein